MTRHFSLQKERHFCKTYTVPRTGLLTVRFRASEKISITVMPENLAKEFQLKEGEDLDPKYKEDYFQTPYIMSKAGEITTRWPWYSNVVVIVMNHSEKDVDIVLDVFEPQQESVVQQPKITSILWGLIKFYH